MLSILISIFFETLDSNDIKYQPGGVWNIYKALPCPANVAKKYQANVRLNIMFKKTKCTNCVCHTPCKS